MFKVLQTKKQSLELCLRAFGSPDDDLSEEALGRGLSESWGCELDAPAVAKLYSILDARKEGTASVSVKVKEWFAALSAAFAGVPEELYVRQLFHSCGAQMMREFGAVEAAFPQF